jgi:SAM-dependent MidA family methyltransferase
MPLSDTIIQKIKENGPLSFREYMEMALYYPESGYYTSPSVKIGPSGDFYTSPYFSSIFSDMIAKQLEEMWDVLDRKPFTIVEYGAGPGDLCCSILSYLKKNEPLYSQLEYFIIEKSEAMREREADVIPEKVKWIQSVSEIKGFNGCVLSNEVADNFAVHRVVMRNQLMEIFVDYQNGFTEIERRASEELTSYFKELNVLLPEGFQAEVNLEAITWIKEIAESIHRGYVLTVDYGFPSAELYRSYRSNGTMVCYYKHNVSSNYYEFIGEQDITTHINFSALRLWGEKYGLDFCGFTNQGRFMISNGVVNYVREMEAAGVRYSEKEKNSLLQTLFMDMGNKFHVLLMGKDAPGQLSGFTNPIPMQ